MRQSILWLAWLVVPVFVLAYHYGPGQTWLARDRAATLIGRAEAHSATATQAQSAAYETQLRLLDARRTAFVAGVDWQTQPDHPLARAVITATTEQDTAYEKAAEIWQEASDSYGKAIETLLKVANLPGRDRVQLSASDRQLLESLRWAEARAMVRSGEVFHGIEQLQALLDLRMAEAHQQAVFKIQRTSTGDSGSAPDNTANRSSDAALPTDAIREELAAAQYVGARLLREEGRPQEVWRPVANAARQHYRYLSAPGNDPNVVDESERSSDTDDRDSLDSDQRLQRNLEQVLNLEQISSEQLEGLPLPRSAPLARRPGDGEPGDQPGKGPGRGPIQDGPPNAGAGVPGPMGAGW